VTRVLLIAILFFVIARTFWRVVDGIIEGASGTPRGRTIKPAMKLVRDPVCGTFVAPKPELSITRRGETQYFCSEKCRDAFSRQQG
jgi:YHS domain-containing protein